MSEIAEKVEKLTPATLDDLAVLANVCTYSNNDLWREKIEDVDWDVQFFRLLVDHVLRLAGKPLILDGLAIPQPIGGSAYRRAKKVWEQRGMSEERKKEIGAAIAQFKGDIWKAPHFKGYHSTAAICNCTEEEYRIRWDWIEDQVKAMKPAAVQL